MIGSMSHRVQAALNGPLGQFASHGLEALQRKAVSEQVTARVYEFSRYVGASAAAVVLDTLVFLGLIGLDVMPAPLAGAVGYACGLVLSYAICVKYIFDVEATGKSNRRLMVEFAASGVLGIVLTFAMIALLVDVIAVQPFIAKVVTVGFVFVAIYVVRAAKIFAPQHGR